MTDRWPRVINGALARFRIQELTSLAENRVGLATQHPFVVVTTRKPLLRDLISDAKMFGQPLHIAFSYLDALIN